VICFNIERNFLGEKMLAPYQFPEKIKVSGAEGDALVLKSIIIHNGRGTTSGHYTCIIKQGSNWMHYDDMVSSLALIGAKFADIAKWKDGYALRNCTQLFYSRL
jgi:ubiquitin C-terminal hydrolase